MTKSQIKAELRPIVINGNHAIIKLTKGYEALIDIDDVHLVSGKNWCASESKRSDGSIKTVYAICFDYSGGKKTQIKMHRILLNAHSQSVVDHIYGNGLNNRRNNIRLVSISQNSTNCRKYSNNTSGFKGVSWSKRRRKWESYIKTNNKTIHLGFFEDINSAAAAYEFASKKIHGEFGRIA